MIYYVSKSNEVGDVLEIWTPGGMAILAKERDQDVRVLSNTEKKIFKDCAKEFQKVDVYTYCPVTEEFVINKLNITWEER